MQTFNLSTPPQPALSSSSSPVQFTTQDMGNVSTSWVGPQNVNDKNSQPDPALWQPAGKTELNMTDYAPISATAPSSATTSIVAFNPSSAPPDQPTGAPPTTATCQTFKDCPSCPQGQSPACSADYTITVQNPGYVLNFISFHYKDHC